MFKSEKFVKLRYAIDITRIFCIQKPEKDSSYVKNPEELFQLKLRGNPGMLKGLRLGVSRIITISYRKRIRKPVSFL